MKEKYYTDYPITELGDKEFTEAPIRECKIVKLGCRNPYIYIEVEGIQKEIKCHYVYNEPKRCGETECVDYELLENHFKNLN